MKCAMKKQKKAIKGLQFAAEEVVKSFGGLGEAFIDSTNIFGMRRFRLQNKIPKHIPDSQVTRYVLIKKQTERR